MRCEQCGHNNSFSGQYDDENAIVICEVCGNWQIYDEDNPDDDIEGYDDDDNRIQLTLS